jgi:Secretion system C-terminal sorting domain
MKTPKPLLLIFLLLLQVSLSAQVQWYQNQDGNNQFPAGTVATSVQPFTTTSFIGTYLWTTNNDTFTWKISKSNLEGTEEKIFLITGITAQVEVRVGKNNIIYVLEKNYPFGQNPEYTVYKLDSNLTVKAQQSVTFPNSFNIFNLNAFEVDKWNNVYLAGDGQYPSGPGFNPASFVLKTNNNLVTQWNRMDSTQTSFTQLHVDRWGTVLLLADFYTFFPDVHLTRISANGQYAQNFTIETDPGRFSLFSALDDNDNLLLYGGKSIGDTAQGMYLYKFSRFFGRIVYRKTHFKSAGSQINDLKVDRGGNIFTLVTEWRPSGEQFSKISRINSNTGNIYWNHSIPYAQDSCNLQKLVVTDNDRFFAIGQRTSNNYFSKGFAMRMKKNGQADGNFPAPDSVNFQRSHWLVDGLADRNNQLIAIGGTTDLDTITFSSSYMRAFAIRFTGNTCNSAARPGTVEIATAATTVDNEKGEEIQFTNKLVVYPNPVQENLTVSGLNKDEYDRISVYNMQGAQLQEQTVNGTTARIDVTTLPGGVYLLVLRSSVTFKEKSIKFVVKK